MAFRGNPLTVASLVAGSRWAVLTASALLITACGDRSGGKDPLTESAKAESTKPKATATPRPPGDNAQLLKLLSARAQALELGDAQDYVATAVGGQAAEGQARHRRRRRAADRSRAAHRAGHRDQGRPRDAARGHDLLVRERRHRVRQDVADDGAQDARRLADRARSPVRGSAGALGVHALQGAHERPLPGPRAGEPEGRQPDEGPREGPRADEARPARHQGAGAHARDGGSQQQGHQGAHQGLPHAPVARRRGRGAGGDRRPLAAGLVRERSAGLRALALLRQPRRGPPPHGDRARARPLRDGQALRRPRPGLAERGHRDAGLQ